MPTRFASSPTRFASSPSTPSLVKEERAYVLKFIEDKSYIAIEGPLLCSERTSNK